MKLLSFQPFPLYTNGGGSRLLRRLYKDKEDQVVSVTCWPSRKLGTTGTIREVIVPMLPIEQFWMRWRLRHWIWNLRLTIFLPYNTCQIRRVTRTIAHDAVHVINHGPYSAALLDETPRRPIWASFHDHFLTTNSPEAITCRLWMEAERRLVISQELASEYCQRFGIKPFEIITDGVEASELSIPLYLSNNTITIYFAGLLHIEYLEPFRILADALDILSESTPYKFILIIRGATHIDFLENRIFKTEYRDNFISDVEIKKEIDSATILYLPTRFHDSNFYFFSLPTKMISYLGAAGAILYHGPEESVTHKILHDGQAATCCCSLSKQDLANKISQAIININKISKNANQLAREKFNMEHIRSNFWQKTNKHVKKHLF